MAINYGQGDANEPSRGYQLYITSLVMILAASLFVAMRLSTRIANKQFGSDDYMITIALASSVVMAAAVNLGVFSINSLIRFYGKAQGHILADMKSVAVVNGYGKRSTDLAPKEKNAALKWFFIAQIFYKPALGFTKISILCLYHRVFVSPPYPRIFQVAIVLISLWAISTTLATIFQCVPLEASWNKKVNGKCIHKNAFWYGYAVTNTTTDFIVFLLPIPALVKLHLHWKEKVGVVGVFALGFFVCITSIIRTTAVAQTTSGEKDITWDFIPRSTWTSIEANTGIICACLPILKGPLVRLFPRLFNATTAKSKGSYPFSQESYNLHQRSNKMKNKNLGREYMTTVSRPESIVADPCTASEEHILDEERIHRWPLEDRIERKTDVTISYSKRGPSQDFR
ncbi:hypothetical protein PABG_05663 [Paracoccidioides brasiliensis Pb03]|nr:hypothetical protein PABG_05663 [Paracoccidioides brasiliensis Pb03]